MAGGKKSEQINSKKKVLFLIHTLQVGGAERVLVNLVNNMDSKKYDITVMTVVDTGALKEELNQSISYKTIIKKPRILSREKSKKNDITGGKDNKKSGNLLNGTSRIKTLAAKAYQFVWRHKNCKRVYRKKIGENYDIEIAFLEGIATKILANSTNKNSKKIAWVHVDLLNERKSEKFYKNIKEEKEAYSSFDKVVCVSNTVRESVLNKTSVDNNKVIVEYNPIDSDRIVKLADEKNEACKKEKFTICSIGRLSTQKAFDRMINCVNRLGKDGIEVELWIIGVGSEEQRLKQLVKEYSMSNVKFLGYQKNPYPFIKSADMIACSSIAEGFSTTISEAVILGKPIVTTDCSGMKEILGEKSEYGLICDNNEESLYDGIKMMIQDKEKLDYYRKVTKERKKIFDILSSVKKIEKVLDEA